MGVVVVVVGALLALRADRDDARRVADADAAALDRAVDARSRADDEEAEATRRRARADADAADAAEARRVQRERLLALGLTEESVDAFVARVESNTELVEWRRDRVGDEVTFQAAQIPQIEQCLVAARHAINIAFGTVIDPDTQVPAPTELCLTLMGLP